MKRIIILMLLIYSMPFSNPNEREVSKTSKFIIYELSEQKSIIDKLDYILSKYQVLDRKETKDYIKLEIVVNEKKLYYAIYKNYLYYKYDLDKFLSNGFFDHVTKSKFKSSYTKIDLSPIISSDVYGRWCTIYGSNQIIKASGDDYYTASLNAEEFFNEIENNKSSLIERIKDFDFNKLKKVILTK